MTRVRQRHPRRPSVHLVALAGTARPARAVRDDDEDRLAGGVQVEQQRGDGVGGRRDRDCRSARRTAAAPGCGSARAPAPRAASRRPESSAGPVVQPIGETDLGEERARARLVVRRVRAPEAVRPGSARARSRAPSTAAAANDPGTRTRCACCGTPPAPARQPVRIAAVERHAPERELRARRGCTAACSCRCRTDP